MAVVLQKSSSHKNVLVGSTTSALFSFASTVLRKALTFTLNLLLVRQVTAETLGGRSDFELVLGSILFLSREACALVLLRAPVGILINDDKVSSKKVSNNDVNVVRRQQFVNTAWLPVPLGLFLISIVSLFHYGVHNQQGGALEIDVTTAFFFISILIEVLASPFVLFAQALLLARGRAATDITAELVRCIVVYLLVVYGHSRISALTAFAIGTLFYSIIVIVGFTLSVLFEQGLNNTQVSLLLPRWIREKECQSRGISAQFGVKETSLLGALALNSIFKHILGEGDRFALLLVGSARAERGVYSAVANFGSLAARLIFQPIEESVRIAVSKLVRIGDLDTNKNQNQKAIVGETSLRGTSREPSRGRTKNANRRGSTIRKIARKGEESQEPTNLRKRSSSRSKLVSPTSPLSPSSTTATPSPLVNNIEDDARSNLLLAADVFACVMRVVIFVGLVFMTFGVLYSPAATRLLFFNKEALPGFSNQLAAYSVYVFFMALNGVSEAFSTGAANENRLANASFHLVGAGIVTAITAFLTVPRYGVAVGIIFANCANMAARTISSLVYIASLLRDKGGSETNVHNVIDLLRLVSPSFLTLVAFIPTVFACWAAQKAFDDGHNVKGLFASIGVGGVSGIILLSVAWIFERKDMLRLVNLLRGRGKKE
jgi:oligosaccharide translocation protein RFT1